MKKISKLFMMLFVLFSLIVFASTTAKAAEAGLYFEEYNRYVINKPFEELPYTVEMEVKIDKDLSGSAGTLFGNFDYVVNGGASVGVGRCYIIEAVNGVIRLGYTNNSHKKIVVEFNDVDVRTSDWVHLAVAFDAANNQVHLYVNGELKSTKATDGDLSDLIKETKFLVGGDNRTLNPAWFKGEYRELAVYSDLRTEEEVMNDYQSGVNLNDEDLMVQYDLSINDHHQNLNDNSGNGYYARYEDTWYDNQEIEMDYAYSFAVVGDTQMLNYWGEENDMNTLYKWIVDNVESQSIKHVFGLGDITETWGKDTEEEEYEWQRAKDAIYQMNGKVSYSLVRGNHDESGFMNEYFNEEAYKSQFDGFYDDTINTSYKTLKVGDVDFLLIGLDYGASDAELAWACELVENHPNHKVIVTTHGYLDQEGNRMGADYPHSPAAGSDYENDANYNHGQGMWEKFISKYENIFLVMSGHISDEDVVYSQDFGVHGNVVTQILIDFQDVDKQYVQNKGQDPAGIVTMLYMNEDCSKVEIAAYSTIRNQYFKKYNHYTIDLNGICEEHTLEYKYNDYKHWQVCECGYKTLESYHEYENGSATAHGTQILTCACGATKEASVATNAAALDLQSLLERYYNNGAYIKGTTIYIEPSKVGDDLASYFHANVDILVRTTYYDGDKLWMSAGDDYSGYGTSADGHLTTFRVTLDGVFGPETVQSNLPGMEEHYVTLQDLILGQHTSAHTGNVTLNLNEGWTYENGIYTNTNADVLDAFRLFTAPAWLNKNATTQNFVTYTKATVDVTSGELVLKLWVSSENKGLFADGYANVDSEGNYLFSQAVISEYYWKGNESSNLHGNGTEANPYLITNTADLMHFGANAHLYADKYVKLITDIDLKGQNFMIASFAGTFDGAGHKISGLEIENVDANTGLFRVLQEGGVIKNLSVDGNIVGAGVTGGIVGLSYGSVSNCNNYATVTGNGKRGGIVGLSYGPISNCNNYGHIATLSTGWNVGGIVGECEGDVTNCNNYATVNGVTTHVGGVIGSLLAGNVTDCNNYGLVSGFSYGAGGILGNIGRNSSKVSGCVNEGQIENGISQVGGIAGKAMGTISNCINNANITNSCSKLGGIVGDAYATTTIISCENNGSISGAGSVSGIVGNLQGGSVKDSVNNAAITGTGGAVGGIVGEAKGVVQNCVNNADATVSGGGWSVAGIVGHAHANVISSKNYASVTGTGGGVAGIVGELVKGKNIKAENCENYGKVTGKQYTGGIVGYLRNNSVVNCVNHGSVNATGNRVGGIAGGSDVTGASITGSENYGNVKGGQHTAGIVGHMQGSVTDCINYGYINSTSSESSSIVGKLWVAADTPTTVNNCVNYGNVKASGWCGGLFGNVANATVTNCTNYGNLEATSGSIGGLIGYVFAGGKLSDCVNYGNLKAPNNVSGIVFNNNGNVSNCYNHGLLTATNADAVVQPICITNTGTITDCELSAANVWDGSTVSTSLQGSGTQEDPFLISSGADLAYIANVVTAHTEYTGKNNNNYAMYNVFKGYYFKLTNNIDLGGNHLIIGYYSGWNNYSVFAGTLDGNNHSISGLNISATALGAGLFGGIDTAGTVKNLNVYGSITSTNGTVGGICGWLSGRLENCKSYVTVTGTTNVGGLIGNAESKTSVTINCINYGSVTATKESVGGIAGCGKATFTNCVNYGSVTTTGKQAGGIAGYGTDQDKVSVYSGCINYGTITGGNYVAGLVGLIQHNLTTGKNYGTVKGASYVGGLVGKVSNGTVTNSNNYGSVSGTGSNISKLVGNGKATDCVDYNK